MRHVPENKRERNILLQGPHYQPAVWHEIFQTDFSAKSFLILTGNLFK